MSTDNPQTTDFYSPSNRERAMEPRGKGFWCDRCDRNHVMAGEKCEVCGARSGKPKRAKKPGPLQ